LEPIAGLLHEWLDYSAYQQFKRHGRFSLNLNKLRIISLNPSAGHDGNFYLISNVTDPGANLEFLYNSLKEAEELD